MVHRFFNVDGINLSFLGQCGCSCDSDSWCVHHRRYLWDRMKKTRIFWFTRTCQRRWARIVEQLYNAMRTITVWRSRLLSLLAVSSFSHPDEDADDWVFLCFLQDFCLHIWFMTITAVAPRIMADRKFNFAVSNMFTSTWNWFSHLEIGCWVAADKLVRQYDTTNWVQQAYGS